MGKRDDHSVSSTFPFLPPERRCTCLRTDEHRDREADLGAYFGGLCVMRAAGSRKRVSCGALFPYPKVFQPFVPEAERARVYPQIYRIAIVFRNASQAWTKTKVVDEAGRNV